MQLSPLQRRVLAAIAAQRDPESYVAGDAASHRRGTRGSAEIISAMLRDRHGGSPPHRTIDSSPGTPERVRPGETVRTMMSSVRT